MAELIVVRHAQASMFAADYDQLSELGHDQARRLGQYWVEREQGFGVVYSGPAKRQQDTAAGVANAYAEAGLTLPPLTVLPGLNEHDGLALVTHGVAHLAHDPDISRLHAAFTGATEPADRHHTFQRLFEAIMQRWWLGAIADDHIKPWPTFRTGVEAALDDMLAQAEPGAGPIVAFTSVGPLAVMLRRALQTTVVRSFETAWRIRNASVTRFVFSRGDGRFTLDSFNALDHLPAATHHTFR